MLPMFNWLRGCGLDPIRLALPERSLLALGSRRDARMDPGMNTRMNCLIRGLLRVPSRLNRREMRSTR